MNDMKMFVSQPLPTCLYQKYSTLSIERKKFHNLFSVGLKGEVAKYTLPTCLYQTNNICQFVIYKREMKREGIGNECFLANQIQSHNQ